MFKRTIALAFLAMIASRPVRADWYRDATAIIEQLIEDNLSTEVIPNAAARVPALCTYFPSSLRAIQQQRYTGLDTVFRKEISDLAGYKVYLEIASSPAVPLSSATSMGGGAGLAGGAAVPDRAPLVLHDNFLVLSPRHRIPEAQFTESANAVLSRSRQIQQTVPSCPLGPDNKVSLDGQTSIATLQMNACAVHQPVVLQEVGCSAALTFRDALDGNHEMLAADVKRLQVALEDEVKGIVPPPPDLAQIIAGLESVLEQLGVPSSLGSETAIAIVLALGEACQASTTCQKLATWATASGAATDIGAIVGAIEQHDYGTAAKTVIELAELLTCGQSCKDQDVLDFISSLAVYITDSVTSGQSTASAEADFRTAVVTLIEKRGAGLGYARKWSTAKALLLPELTLREAWNPGHLNVDGSATLQYASVDWVTVRSPLRYTQWVYVAPQFSAFDLLGPLSNLATSGHLLDGETRAHRVAAALESLVVPRLTLEVGIPALSRNLVVGVSGALRLYREKATSATTGIYCFYGSRCSADSNLSGLTTDNLEFGVHVTYVP